MYLFRIFYSFLPLRNPLGFGSSDFVILAIAMILVVLLVAKEWVTPLLPRLAARTMPCMALLFSLAILLRISLMAHSPPPIPSGADDFSYLLLGDTLAHFRLANASHPLHQFFEAVFILQQPTYASIYPLGQGFVLAAGELFGNPWIGVLISSGLFCALCYWMLRAWTTPVWALTGGALALIQFGPLSPWVNTYWGGYVSAIAGCLVFGALPRLRKSNRLRDGVFVGMGLALQMISRPFEAIFLFVATAVYVAFSLRPGWRLPIRPLSAALAIVSCAGALMLLQNKAVTQDWTTLPYVLSRYQYGVPATMTFQSNPVPHRAMTVEQELDYRAQTAIHGNQPETFAAYFGRLTYRLRYLRFFVLPPLFCPLLAFIPSIRRPSYLWAFGTLILFLLGTNFYPYFYPHYVAALTCLFLLFSIRGLEVMGSSMRSVVLLLSVGSFLFWFGIYASGDSGLMTAADYQAWQYINQGDPQGRNAIQDQLSRSPGQHLVIVRYAPSHRFEEWVHNAADIDGSQTVWADDLGREENEILVRYFPNRKAWLLEPDARPPLLTPYAFSR